MNIDKDKLRELRETYAEYMAWKHCTVYNVQMPNHIIKDAFRIGFEDGYKTAANSKDKIESLGPIEVTAEILNINGFKYRVYSDIYGNTVSVKDNVVEIRFDNKIRLHLPFSKLYVHKLLECLKICGFVELVRNFKLA